MVGTDGGRVCRDRGGVAIRDRGPNRSRRGHAVRLLRSAGRSILVFRCPSQHVPEFSRPASRPNPVDAGGRADGCAGRGHTVSHAFAPAGPGEGCDTPRRVDGGCVRRNRLSRIHVHALLADRLSDEPRDRHGDRVVSGRMARRGARPGSTRRSRRPDHIDSCDGHIADRRPDRMVGAPDPAIGPRSGGAVARLPRPDGKP